MSDKNTSTIKWIRESGLQIVSALIGSSLLVTALSAVYSEFNQPSLYLGITPHFESPLHFNNSPKVDYYEVIIRNDGKTAATNVIVSMYFFDKINDHTIFFSDEVINPLKEQHTGTEATLLRGEIPRITSGAMTIVYVYTNASKYDPYYISATFDQGSSSYPVFRPVDIEEGKYPNILAGSGDTQTIQLIIVISSILCAISFSIAIVYKKIKKRIADRRIEIKSEKSKHLDLFQAIPIIIISGIFILYICEELPKSILIPSLIVPPLDASEGASINTIVHYKNIPHRQGDLLLYAGIFWIFSLIARSAISYLISKRIINNLYKKNERPSNNLLWLSCLSIMGVPIDYTITIFFSKLTYSISPVYLFSIFYTIDIIRMAIIVLVIPRISLKSNDIFYGTLSASTILSGIVHFVLFFVLYKNSLDVSVNSEFLTESVFYIFLLLGILCMFRFIISIKFKTSIWMNIGWIIGFIIFISWCSVLYIVTTNNDRILLTGLPFISIGILVMPLEAVCIIMSRLVRIRKINSPKFTIDHISNPSNQSPNSCIPISKTIRLSGLLESEIKHNSSKEITIEIIGNEEITIEIIGNNKILRSFNAETDRMGKFVKNIDLPSTVEDNLKIRACYKGRTTWITKFKELRFDILVNPPVCSKDREDLIFCTRLHMVSLSITAGIFDKDGNFETNRDYFLTSELVSFIVVLRDEDTNSPIEGQETIELKIFGMQHIVKVFPATDEKGESIISLKFPSTTSNKYIYQAYYPGNSKYAKAYSSRGSLIISRFQI